ncbi:ApeA N-terminal domain 1-containing protein [Microcoleus sp. D3_18_C4]|uniref:ApeA N-terminal domain 1-containing protein n=1 Tax=Microcoleus sp. D3_18_C4 TaxID=3055335 RepID=UPI002FD34580
MEEFVSLGEWWLPNNPEVVVAGKLSFSPISGAKLELIGSFYDSPFEEYHLVD